MRIVERSTVSALTASQMREVDRALVEDLHLELVQMMENAGARLTDLVLSLFAPESATVLAGPGGNGGGGLVAARHLANRGVDVSVTLSRQATALAPVTAHQLDVVQRMGIEVTADPRPSELVVDALIGYGLYGRDPSGPAAVLIDWANAQGAPVVALDAPSGLDVTSGQAGSPCVLAAATLTLGLPKTGLLTSDAAGRLFVADVSVPPGIYRRVGIAAPLSFARDAIVEVGPDSGFGRRPGQSVGSCVGRGATSTHAVQRRAKTKGEQ
jgi:NAD(P)H-hydrate epimerase